MKRPPLSVALVLAVLVIAIWYGGKVPIGLPPAEGWFAAFLLERSHPWLAQAILALLIAVVGFVVSLKRTVHLAPTRALGICLLGAWVWIIVSSFGSKHPPRVLRGPRALDAVVCLGTGLAVQFG
ncbi:MAG: hypothetical protein KatS3mg015_1615 [Fimbriimonadales bacterium]|nr:MAG: hypothetical protein KatS3mg015_1615 [Fimbriimonadales bacterium]